jgi:hypothetical protein
MAGEALSLVVHKAKSVNERVLDFRSYLFPVDPFNSTGL